MTRLAEAFRYQARACADLGSPFMALLMRLCAERLRPGTPLTDRLFDWAGDLGPRGASVPLRLAGALHRLKLEGDPGLGAVYPPRQLSDDDLWSAVAQALSEHAPRIDRIVDSAPQTNEVRRAAVFIAAAHEISARFGLPLRWWELGASAGLNLHWDAYALDAPSGRLGPPDAQLVLSPEWHGTAPTPSTPTIADRAGVDLAPLDPTQDRLRLLSYLWPDQPERLRLTEAAIAAATTLVVKADAVDWLTDRLAPVTGVVTVIAHSVAWQYFLLEKQVNATAAIEAAGHNATESAPLAWLSMENDGALKGAALRLRLWPGDVMLDLGRADFHGRWIKWRVRPMFQT